MAGPSVNKQKRGANVSIQQKTKILEYMESHPELCNGKFSGKFTKRDADAMWEEISEICNSDGSGPIKSATSWKNCWKDFRLNVEKRAAKIKNSLEQTGGGYASEFPLTPIEERVAGLLRSSTIYGTQGERTGASALSGLISGEIPVVVRECHDDVDSHQSSTKLDKSLEQVLDISSELMLGQSSELILGQSSELMLGQSPELLVEPVSVTSSVGKNNTSTGFKRKRPNNNDDKILKESVTATKALAETQRESTSALSLIAVALNRIAAAKEKKMS